MRRISIHALLAESDRHGNAGDMYQCKFLSTLSLRRATDSSELNSSWISFLSTLSLRRATRKGLAMRWNTCISIHALLAESDLTFLFRLTLYARFLSTLSLRRATSTSGILCFYPLISIHALLAESDTSARIASNL